MAQRKKSGAAQRRKTARSRSTPSRAAAAKKATKRRSAKAAPRKKLAETKTKPIVSRQSKRKASAPRKQSTELPTPVIKVERVDEVAPGVVVVSELESVQVGSAPVVPDEVK